MDKVTSSSTFLHQNTHDKIQHKIGYVATVLTLQEMCVYEKSHG